MMHRIIAAASLVLLADCGGSYSPDTYSAAAVQQANKAEQGIIVGERAVDVQTSGAVGAATGGATGGVAGAQTPGGLGSAFGAIGGALIGGLIGSTVERTATDTTATEYIIRKANGELVSVTQKDVSPLPIGTKVLVISGAQARVVVDYTAPADALPLEPAPGQAKPPAVASTPLAAPGSTPSPPPGGPTSLAPPPRDAEPLGDPFDARTRL